VIRSYPFIREKFTRERLAARKLAKEFSVKFFVIVIETCLSKLVAKIASPTMALAVAGSLDQTASFHTISFDRIKSYAKKYSTTRVFKVQTAHEVRVG
jgi:hypothetical protein